ncbi:MAG: TlpA family protein disulfide reductase [Nitrospirae bacterium]|nr:TlpA family protein disulfide reductase [Nitrospirota bacterium]
MRVVGRRNLLLVLLIILSIPLFLTNATAADEKAPDFSLPSIEGSLYRLSDLHGKVVILNFWATWCTPCLEEMPALDILNKRYKDKGLVILGISIDRKRETLEEFLSKNPVSYPILLDQKGEVFVNKFTVTGLPATYVVDKDGYIVEQYTGKKDFTSQEFTDLIERLLKGGNEG